MVQHIIDLLKTTIAGFISSIIVYFDPVAGKLESLMALFALNFMVGFIAGKIKHGENFSLKKFRECFSWAAIILVIICAFYFIGEHNGDQKGTIECLHIAILVAIWAFGTNIFRNLCEMSEGNDPVYRFFFACYYWLSFDFIKRIPFLAELTGQARSKRQHQARPLSEIAEQEPEPNDDDHAQD